MIRVRCSLEEGIIEIKGHAGAGEYGHDLICAGASMLLHTLMRALDGKFEGYAVAGEACIKCGNTEKNREILRTVMAGYEWLGENYPGFVRAEWSEKCTE